MSSSEHSGGIRTKESGRLVEDLLGLFRTHGFAPRSEVYASSLVRTLSGYFRAYEQNHGSRWELNRLFPWWWKKGESGVASPALI
jgi:hypothetical protein